MDRLTLRVSADLIRRFDAAAVDQGGRSRLLRRLMEGAARKPFPERPAAPAEPRSGKLTVRLTDREMALLQAEAASVGLSRTQWSASLIRRRLEGRAPFTPPEAMALIECRRELRRIGVNVNQIARALNTAVLEGAVLGLELAQIDAYQAELRGWVEALGEAFEGNLAYWSEPVR